MEYPKSAGDVRLSHLLREQSITTLKPDQTIGEALRLLASAEVLSAPLVTETGSGQGQTLQGWIDLQTILRGLLSQLKQKHGRLPSAMLLLMKELEQEGPLFSAKPLSSVCAPQSLGAAGLAGSGVSCSSSVLDRAVVSEVDADSCTLLDLVRSKFLPEGPTGHVVHRCAVIGAGNAIKSIVSQLDAIRFLAARPSLLGALASRPISSLPGLMHAPVISVDAGTLTLLALDAMLKSGVSAAPVVSGDGELLANLSVSDLRGLQSHHLGKLGLPVAEFTALTHKTSYLGYSQRTSADGTKHEHFANAPPTAAEPSLLCASQSRGSKQSGSMQAPGHARTLSQSSGGPGAAAAGSCGAPAGPEDRMHVHGATGRASDAAATTPAPLHAEASHAGSMLSRHSSSGGGSSMGMPEASSSAGGGGESEYVRLLTLLPSHTLLDVLHTLSAQRVHRVYVLDPAKDTPHVLGIVTPTDVLQVLLAAHDRHELN